jgi:ubiquinone biosynthesis protein COQ9
MTAKKKKPDNVKAALLEAALKHVVFDGFSDKALARAAEETGLGKEAVARLFPHGPLSLVEAFSDSADAAMEGSLAAMDLKAMKIRARIAAAVMARIEALRPHKEAARRAAAFLTLPPHAALGARLVWRTVDAMWRAVGDTATDFNFYTKRGILAGVYSSTLMRWFTDTSADEHETTAFLAGRIENVMTFEKFKAQAKEAVSRLPSLAEVLGSLGPRR